ncbi:MAG: serine/threonine protein kinase [Myxococcales bacterium]|nr:serine/threonine protein kinase [Myxococcales bacterium]
MGSDNATVADGEPPPVIQGTFAGWIGTTIEGRYRLREMLGEGGMGAVFIAEHLKLKKDVAVKIIRPAVAADESIAERFRREARATAQIDNPHVVHAIDFGKLSDGSDFFVLQLVQGRPLSDLLMVEGARPWQWVCEIGGQIADALAAVHEIGLVHRDLKPDNIIITERDDGKPHVYVLDFGIARDTEGAVSMDEQNPLTRAGAVLGTPGYMSPQQISGDAVNFSADLYALGVILWECLAGRGLWDADTIAEMFAKQLREAPPPLLAPSLRPDIPPPLARLIESLLERSPDARPANAELVRHELMKLVRDAKRSESAATAVSLETMQITRGDATRPELSAAAPVAQASTSRAPAVSPSPDRRKLMLMIGIPLALLVVIVLIKSLAGGAPETDAPETSDAPAKVAKKTSEPATQKSADAPAKAITPRGEAKEQGELPKALKSAFETVSGSRSDGRRKKAAKEILKHEPQDEVPEVARLVAELQMAEACSAKKVIVEKLAALRDPRGVKTLQRYEPRGFTACGRRDCYGCMRETMAEALRAMGTEPSERTLKAIGEIE